MIQGQTESGSRNQGYFLPPYDTVKLQTPDQLETTTSFKDFEL